MKSLIHFLSKRMELVGKTSLGRAFIERHGKNWVVFSSDEKYHLIESEKTGWRLKILIENDPNFHKIRQIELF